MRLDSQVKFKLREEGNNVRRVAQHDAGNATAAGLVALDRLICVTVSVSDIPLFFLANFTLQLNHDWVNIYFESPMANISYLKTDIDI